MIVTIHDYDDPELAQYTTSPEKNPEPQPKKRRITPEIKSEPETIENLENMNINSFFVSERPLTMDLFTLSIWNRNFYDTNTNTNIDFDENENENENENEMSQEFIHEHCNGLPIRRHSQDSNDTFSTIDYDYDDEYEDDDDEDDSDSDSDSDSDVHFEADEWDPQEIQAMITPYFSFANGKRLNMSMNGQENEDTVRYLHSSNSLSGSEEPNRNLYRENVVKKARPCECIVCFDVIDGQTKSLGHIQCSSCSSLICETCIPLLIKHGKLHDTTFRITCPCVECTNSFDDQTLLQFNIEKEIWDQYQSRITDFSLLTESRNQYSIPCQGCNSILVRDAITGSNTSTPTLFCPNSQCTRYKEHVCYTCQMRCVDANCCAVCMESRECENPEYLNRYYIDPNTKKMCKNKDITLDMALAYIQYIKESDKILPHCTLCNVAIEKSVDCNAISHCGCEICYVCGRREIPEATKKDQVGLESSHWVRCPRFFECDQVKHELGYVCKQGKCFSEHEPCMEKSHQKGIKDLEQFRKERHLGAFVESLPVRIKRGLAF